MMRFPKYKQNLGMQEHKVWCYESNIARKFSDRLEVLNRFKKYSHTTTKHYNYVAGYFELPIVFVDEFSDNITNYVALSSQEVLSE